MLTTGTETYSRSPLRRKTFSTSIHEMFKWRFYLIRGYHEEKNTTLRSVLNKLNFKNQYLQNSNLDLVVPTNVQHCEVSLS